MRAHDEDINDGGGSPATTLWKALKWPVILTGIFFLLQVVIQPRFMLEVPPGYAAALAFGGDVDNTVYMPGAHPKMPWQSAVLMKIWTVAEARDTTPTDFNNQAITATIAPQIWIDPKAVPALARKYKDYDSLMKRLVDPQINQAARGQTSLRVPEKLIWERPEVIKGIETALQAAISEQLVGNGLDPNAVRVGLVSVEQFGFSPAVTGVLEAKAESEVNTHIATAKAKILGITADTEALQREKKADGDAKAKQLIAEANAYKVQKVGDANAAAPDVAKYEAIMNWLAAGGKSSRVQLGAGTPVIVNGVTAAPASGY